MKSVAQIFNKWTNNLQVIPFFKLSDDYTVIESTPHGYLKKCDHPYTLTFQVKFFQDKFGFVKFNEKDEAYLKFIYDQILEMAYMSWNYNIYFKEGDEQRLEFIHKRCPSLLKAMKEFNDFKHSETIRKINEIKILGARTQEEHVMKYLVEKKLLNYDEIVPMFDPYCSIALNKGRLILEMSGNEGYDREKRRKAIFAILFPFLIPHQLSVVFAKDHNKPFYSSESLKSSLDDVFDDSINMNIKYSREFNLNLLDTIEKAGREKNFRARIWGNYNWRNKDLEKKADEPSVMDQQISRVNEFTTVKWEPRNF